MPRSKSIAEKTTQVSFHIPNSWLARAKKIVGNEKRLPGVLCITRTDILRSAMGLGLTEIEKQSKRLDDQIAAIGRHPSTGSHG